MSTLTSRPAWFTVSLAIMVLFASLLPPSVGWAEPCESYPVFENSLIGDLPLEYVSSMAIDGSLAYVGGSIHGFKVLDLTNPIQPVQLSEFNIGLYLLNQAWVEPAGDVGFIGGVMEEIPFIDLSDPLVPKEILRFPVLFEVQATAVEGNFLYAATYGRRNPGGVDTAGFYIVDVSQPSAPVQLAEILDNHYWAFSLEVRNSVAFLGASSGFHTFDVSDPGAVVELDVLDLYTPPVDMQFVGDLLYLAGYTGELHIVDVSDPANMVILSTTDLGVGVVSGISVHNGQAVIACKAAGLRVVDVSDPANPSEPATWATSGYCYDVLLAEDRVSVLTSKGLLVAAPELPGPVAPLSTRTLDSYPTRMVLEEDLLYYLEQGLHISDVSDPAAPVEIGFFTNGYNYSRMSLDDSVVYLGAIGSGGVIAVDVSDPANPVQLSSLTSEQVYSVHAAKGLVAIGPRSGFVSVYDVADPANPVLLGAHTGDSPYRAYGVVIASNFIYLDTGTTSVLDMTDKKNIHTVASVGTGYGLDLVANGEWIYTASDLGISVLRFTPPNNLTLMGSRAIPEDVHDLHLNGAVLSAACQLSGVHVFDILDPAKPILIGGISGADKARCVAADKDLMIIGSSTYPVSNDGVMEIYPALCTGLYSPVPEGDLPVSPMVLSAFPNPFNPQVRFSFAVERATFADLSIFDLGGRRVATIVNEHITAGLKHFNWNGLDASGGPAASGSYVARLQAGGVTTSAKVTLLR